MGVGVGVCAINIRYRVYIHDVYLNICSVVHRTEIFDILSYLIDSETLNLIVDQPIYILGFLYTYILSHDIPLNGTRFVCTINCFHLPSVCVLIETHKIYRLKIY